MRNNIPLADRLIVDVDAPRPHDVPRHQKSMRRIANFQNLLEDLAPIGSMIKVERMLHGCDRDTILGICDHYSPGRFLADLKAHGTANMLQETARELLDFPIPMVTVSTCSGRSGVQAFFDVFTEHMPEATVVAVTAPSSSARTRYPTEKDPEMFRLFNYQTRAQMMTNHLRDVYDIGGRWAVGRATDICVLRDYLPFATEMTWVAVDVAPAGVAVRHDDKISRATPREAIRAGADYCVIGRPITEKEGRPATPSEMAEMIMRIYDEINDALAAREAAAT